MKGSHYEALPTSENASEAPSCSHFEQEDPPSYEEEVAERHQQDQSRNNPAFHLGSSMAPTSPSGWNCIPVAPADGSLPSYEAATKLPTYEDVEEEKEEEARISVVDALFNLRHVNYDEPRLNGVDIGSDCVFAIAFLGAFFFNWIGLFVAYCIMCNLAGRFGATAGFGSSMIKWLAYIRYSGCCPDYYLYQHMYLYWIMTFFASIMVIKGVVNWLDVRRYRNMPDPEQCPDYEPQDCDAENSGQ